MIRRALTLLPLLAVPSLAHYDPGGTKAVHEQVNLLSVSLVKDGDADFFFGADDAGTVRFHSRINQAGHDGDAQTWHSPTYQVNDDDPTTTTINLNVRVYNHLECQPVEEPVSYNFSAEELDSTSNEELAGVNGTFVLRRNTGAVVVGQNGGGTFTYQILVDPEPAMDSNCPGSTAAVTLPMVPASTVTSTPPASVAITTPATPTTIPGVHVSSVTAPGRKPRRVSMRFVPGHLDANPGQEVIAAAVLRNESDIPLEGIRVTVRPVHGATYVTRYEGGREVVETSAVLPSPQAWLPREEIVFGTVEPGETKKLSWKFRIADTAKTGDYAFKITAWRGAEFLAGEFQGVTVRFGALPVTTPPTKSYDDARREDRIQLAAALTALAAAMFFLLRRLR